MAQRIEVFVVDDDAAVRDSLRWLVESANHPATAFADGDTFLNAFQPQGPGCVVTDVRMPGMDGLSLLKQTVQRSRMMPVIVITGHGDIQMAVEAMKDGAFDFVEKPFEEKDLLNIIEAAITESTERFRRRDRDGSLWAQLERLSPRENQVLECLVDGMSNRNVAQTLSISEKTVEAHRAHIMEKMDAASFADLVSQVVKSRMAPTDDRR